MKLGLKRLGVWGGRGKKYFYCSSEVLLIIFIHFKVGIVKVLEPIFCFVDCTCMVIAGGKGDGNKLTYRRFLQVVCALYILVDVFKKFMKYM